MKKFILSLSIVAVTGLIQATDGPKAALLIEANKLNKELELINAKCDAKIAKLTRYAFDCLFIGTVALTATVCTGPAALCAATTANSAVMMAGITNLMTRLRELEAKRHYSNLLHNQKA